MGTEVTLERKYTPTYTLTAQSALAAIPRPARRGTRAVIAHPLVMGPVPQTNLPIRPKFSWDAKSPPWTDGKRDQQEYRDAVKLWQTFHDSLPNSNSNKIPSALQAVCLKSQLYGRAKDLCSGITDA